jgi:hypothetical protein
LFIIPLVADDSQHFAVGLHGLGQVLHNLHIALPPEVVWKNFCFLAADLGQHLAVVSHVLNQILDNNILHNKNTSKIEYEKF